MSFTHLNQEGRGQMVDISNKEDSQRQAIAHGLIYMQEETLIKIKEEAIKKGDVLAIAQVAGIQGAKETSRTIPMCHNINLTGVDLSFDLHRQAIFVQATVKTTGKTGVEMEALQAVQAALATIYDMCKALDKKMRMGPVYLYEKTGGKSGVFQQKSRIGRLAAINISEQKGTKKQPVDQAVLRANHGIEGDAHAGDWHRQVSLLDRRSIEKMEAQGLKLAYGDFAENLTTEGLDLYQYPVGTVFQVGSALLELTQIGKDCHQGCQIKQAVGHCIMPTEGIFCQVLKGGIIKNYDTILVLE